MDYTFNGITWVGSIYQKFEDMCLEVDEIMRQERLNCVEGQLQIVGANVRQFCSEIMQDVLPPSSVPTEKEAVSDLSVEQTTDVAAYKKSIVGIDEEHFVEGPCNVDHLLHSSSVEPVKVIDIGLSLEENVDIGMNEKSEVDVKEYPIREKQIQLDISDIIPSGERDLSMALLSHELHRADNEMAVDSGANMLLPAPDGVEGSNSFMKTGEEIDAAACNSGGIPSPDSVSLVESCESKVGNVELSSGDASAVSIGRSDDYIAEESRDDDITKKGSTVRSSDKVKLDESCIMVDHSDLYSFSQEAPKDRSYKKKLKEALASKIRLRKKQDHNQHATCYKDLGAGLDQQKGKSFTSSTLAKDPDSPDQEFCESEWEIV